MFQQRAFAARRKHGRKQESLNEEPVVEKIHKVYHLEFSDHNSLSIQSRHLVESTAFEVTIIGSILIVSAVMGLQTYETSSAFTKFLDILEYIVLAIFTLEIFLKIIAEGKKPWRYFTGPMIVHEPIGNASTIHSSEKTQKHKKVEEETLFRKWISNYDWQVALWNWFDVAIVISSFVRTQGQVALIRLLKLCRMGKLVKQFPELQMILAGLFGGLQALVYISVLLILVFYLYAIMGYYAFRDNDPWHFGTLMISILTFWRCATLEDWSDVFYINYYGCEEYLHVYVSSDDRDETNTQYWCQTPRTRWILSWGILVSFIVVASLVLLSLFIGAITMNLMISYSELESKREAVKRNRLLERERRKIETKEQMKSLRFLVKKLNTQRTDQEEARNQAAKTAWGSFKASTTRCVGRWCRCLVPGMLTCGHTTWTRRSLKKLVESKVTLHTGMLSQMQQAVSLADMEEHNLIQSFMEAAFLGEKVVLDTSKMTSFVSLLSPGLQNYYFLSLRCLKLSSSLLFKLVMNGTIVFSAVLTGVQTFPWDESTEAALDVLDISIVVIFTFEAVVKIIATNFRPSRYFGQKWNQLDFSLVIVCWGQYAIPALQEYASILKCFFLIRAFRILKLIQALPELAILVEALLSGVKSMGFITVVVFFVIYIFAYLGTQFFGDNDPWHFGTMHWAILTLIRCATLDDWTDVMYINMYGCDVYVDVYGDFPDQCVNPQEFGWGAAIFFVIFSLIGAQILLTLFIGVVTSSMDETTKRIKKRLQVQKEILQIKEKNGLSDLQIALYHRAFEIIDLDDSGTIGTTEFILGITSLGLKSIRARVVKNIIREVDTDHDMYINESEFVNFMLRVQTWHLTESSKYHLQPNVEEVKRLTEIDKSKFGTKLRSAMRKVYHNRRLAVTLKSPKMFRKSMEIEQEVSNAERGKSPSIYYGECPPSPSEAFSVKNSPSNRRIADRPTMTIEEENARIPLEKISDYVLRQRSSESSSSSSEQGLLKDHWEVDDYHSPGFEERKKLMVEEEGDGQSYYSNGTRL